MNAFFLQKQTTSNIPNPSVSLSTSSDESCSDALSSER